MLAGAAVINSASVSELLLYTKTGTTRRDTARSRGTTVLDAGSSQAGGPGRCQADSPAVLLAPAWTPDVLAGQGERRPEQCSQLERQEARLWCGTLAEGGLQAERNLGESERAAKPGTQSLGRFQPTLRPGRPCGGQGGSDRTAGALGNGILMMPETKADGGQSMVVRDPFSFFCL